MLRQLACVRGIRLQYKLSRSSWLRVLGEETNARHWFTKASEDVQTMATPHVHLCTSWPAHLVRLSSSGAEMACRSIDHILQYGELTLRQENALWTVNPRDLEWCQPVANQLHYQIPHHVTVSRDNRNLHIMNVRLYESWKRGQNRSYLYMHNLMIFKF